MKDLGESSSSNVKSVGKQHESLVKTRKYLRAQVTRIYNIVSNALNFESLNSPKKLEYTQKLISLREKLDETDQNIYALMSEEADIDAILSDQEIYSDRITESLSILDPVNSGNSFVSPPDSPILSQPIMNSSPNLTKIKLPTISLPTFSNDKKESLGKFLYALESILDKHNLSDYEKFVYLKGQLHEGPKSLIESLDSGE